MFRSISNSCAVLFFLLLSTTSATAQVRYEVEKRIDVAPVWSGHSVGFALLTEGDWLFAAFYDAEQNMTVTQRRLSETTWTFKKLPTKIGWDSHNYVTMALDKDKYLHVSGNMHCVPLIYFRSEKPLDITSLKQISSMTGENEQYCTYPQFLTGPNKEFIFTYRDGNSGNGNQIWNIYDTDKKVWNRLFNTPMFDGQGKMNAYFLAPVIGSDGFYHLCWMWRDTGDCSTNHDLSYVRSRDLRHWENSSGEPVKLPITVQTGEIVDAAQPGEGLVNFAQNIGFDTKGRVVISYGKYDADGNYQLYNARLENGEWKYYQTSNWKYCWSITGFGTISVDVLFGAIEVQDGKLAQNYWHIKEGNGRWFLDEETLKPVGQAPPSIILPKELEKVELDFPNVQSRSVRDLRDANHLFDGGSAVRYVMNWETLPVNRDHPHPVTPPPSMLRVYELKKIKQ